MYCPQCGQQQVSDEVRFCSRCGFQLAAVTGLLATGGIPSLARAAAGGMSSTGGLSPRQKGVRQGAMLMLSTMLVVPLVAIISVFLNLEPFLVAVTSVMCFIGGLLRILYALLLEEKAPPTGQAYAPPYVAPAAMPAQVAAPSRGGAALPPAQSRPVEGYRPRSFNTSEFATPPGSVTENTTRLLDNRAEPPADES